MLPFQGLLRSQSFTRGFPTSPARHLLARLFVLGSTAPGRADAFNTKREGFRNEGGSAEREEQVQRTTRQGESEGSEDRSTRHCSLIYGITNGQEPEKEKEKTIPQTSTRRNYVYAILFDDVKSEKVDEYVQLIGDTYPTIAKALGIEVDLVGSWKTLIGNCNNFVHIWRYSSLTGYHTYLRAVAHHPKVAEVDKKLGAYLNSQKISLVQEFYFWPTSPTRKFDGLFELRSYRIQPGSLWEWEMHWEKGLKARRGIMEDIGAWFVQIGELTTVYHLWHYADLQDRKSKRAQSWGAKGWADTVHKTMPLIQTMSSQILVPMPRSSPG